MVRGGLTVTGAIVATALAATACSRGATTASEAADRRARTPRTFAAAVDGLCAAQRDASSDPAAAKASFDDRSDDALHEIARLLEDTDRAAAAALLIAKQRVEADFEGAPASGDLSGDLARLVDATREGLRRLDLDGPACGS